MISLLGMTPARRRIVQAGINYEASRAAEIRTDEARAEAERTAKLPTSMRILAEVAKAHKLEVNEIVIASNAPAVVSARGEAAWRMRQETSLSWPRIGQKLNSPDSTVRKSARRYQARLDAASSESRT